MKKGILMMLLCIVAGGTQAAEYENRRPPVEERLFVSPAVEEQIVRVKGVLTNPKLV